jgi:hypothetical protein
MWTCPKCQSRVSQEWDVCWSCGTSADGEEDPSFDAEVDAPTPRKPVLDPELAPTLDDELPGPPPEFVVVYETAEEIAAHYVTEQLCRQGIRALKTSDVRAINTSVLHTIGQVTVHPDDLTRAQEWLIAYERHRRHREQRRRHREQHRAWRWGSDEEWGAMLLGGLLASVPCLLLGATCYAVIAFLTPESLVAPLVGTALGLAVWVFLMIRLYQARQRAAALREQAART